MPNSKGYKMRPEGHYQPAKLSEREREGQASGKTFGSSHEFNIKGKVTSNDVSNYHDMGNKDAKGNFSDKDASMEYLHDRNKKGQRVMHFSGLEYSSKVHTGNGGGTVYNGNPIDETYIRSTRSKAPGPDAVIRPGEKKSEEA